MNDNRQKIWLVLILVAAGAGLYYGWRLFWFMTDDALIAFRYASNSILGLGYTWNPPPFRPVEGYTSFLWVVMLDYVWRWFGAEPPQIANWLSLLFSALTLGLTAWIVMRMRLSEALSRFRLIFLALVLAGVLSNRTFLAWSSSGLETALFNFCLTLWICVAVLSQKRDAGWLFGLTLTASLVYLARPDGLLILATTALMAFVWIRSNGNSKPLLIRLSGLLPLTIPIVHIVWRRATYGEWLPNTYYAKHVAAWPESGLRYLASFALEYGLWFWLALLIACCWRWLRRGTIWQDIAGLVGAQSKQTTFLGLVLLTIVGHIGYYTLMIGGDHFEYRVFSYLVPLVFVSAVWMLNRLVRDQAISAILLGLFILVSWPIPWTHWAVTKDLTSRDDTWRMWVPVAPELPTGLQWYAGSFDKLQDWLIERHVCMRHQEHKVFYQYLSRQHPERSLDVPGGAETLPVAACQSTGVPGWVYPRVPILDAFGLNDYVVARHKPYQGRVRQMAHDRYPPVGYLGSFSVNYGRMANKSSGFVPRDYEITANDIAATEQFWIDRIVGGRKLPFSYEMLNRIGESFSRTSDPDSAVMFLEQAIALDGTESRAYVNLANYYSKLGRLDSTLALLRVAHRLDPESPLVQTRLGRAHAAFAYGIMGTDSEAAQVSQDSAMTHLSAVLERAPSQVEALTEQASIMLFRDQIDSSAVLLSRLEQLAVSAGGMKLLGDRFAFKQRRGLALRAYRLAIRNDLNAGVTEELLRSYPELRH